MGEVRVPATALYGASTRRAVENFPISDRRFGRWFIWALGLIKGGAAQVAGSQGFLPEDVAEAIAAAAEEVREGRLDDHFVLDIFQTGSGTSTNTNANEVIANRATQLLGGQIGDGLVHPNDQVNFGQSSNDVIPTATHVAAVAALVNDLLPALNDLAQAFDDLADRFSEVVKSGRTHLMDATPVTLGQEFSAYAQQMHKGVGRIQAVLPDLSELALGGTAVGTGINAPPGFAAQVIEVMSDKAGLPFTEAANHFEAQAAKDAVVMASGALKTVAVSLFKITNDLRWLASGPRAGLGEIRLPALQPGSSIMPGKVNPVMPEMVMQVAAQVIGNDAALTWGGANGNFQLNVMMPLIAHNLLESIGLLANAAAVLRERCIAGIEADTDRIRSLVEDNLVVVTALNPRIGYDQGARVAKQAYATGQTIRQVVLELGLMEADELDQVLDLKKMTEGGIL
ncbi:MAG: class II fumarate hydratase [Acidimicrobiia bacterium]|nr:class II fumarate hydratase [Acidimicrobiia bacterium]MXZ06892.1 class II fumarate hydratase [Acidimicrobiia bacterium]MYF26698.1 class II fumarate hydratase [Acidimicrobiia bacterium]